MSQTKNLRPNWRHPTMGTSCHCEMLTVVAALKVFYTRYGVKEHGRWTQCKKTQSLGRRLQGERIYARQQYTSAYRARNSFHPWVGERHAIQTAFDSIISIHKQTSYSFARDTFTIAPQKRCAVETSYLNRAWRTNAGWIVEMAIGVGFNGEEGGFDG